MPALLQQVQLQRCLAAALSALPLSSLQPLSPEAVHLELSRLALPQQQLRRRNRLWLLLCRLPPRRS